jgi:hypothetical protein
VGTVRYTDPHTGATGAYDLATWTSPRVRPGFAATEVIPSWTADTPGGSWIQVDLRGTTEAGGPTRWYTLARWAADDTHLRRTSVPAQKDADGEVAADTFRATAGYALTSWQVRVTLLGPAGTTATPTLRSAGAVASRLPASGGPAADDGGPEVDPPAPSHPPVARAVTLDVPCFSQQTHLGHYPQWNGGGAAWCSPTSTSMVLAFWGAGPTPDDYAWVDPSDPRPCVDHAARHCFDHAYRGVGNWPFNTAYAGRYGMVAFVTRLRSLDEAELFIAAGVPLVVSASYGKGEIPGLDYDTNGHLMVLVGFTGTGDPVLNDPHSPTNEAVRKRVDRAAFEAAWLTASGGLVYVIRPASVPLPAAPAQPNW